MTDNFIANTRRGKTGEEYVMAHLGDLTGHLIANQRNRADEHVEGGDTAASRLKLGDEMKDFLPEYADAHNLNQSGNPFWEVTEILSGGVEIKTTWDFLTKTYDHEDGAGTLPFALWTSNSKENAGWLQKIMHPERFNAPGVIPQAVQPHTLVFLLVAYENPFASIAFCDVPALIERLRSLAKGNQVDLDDGIPLGEDAQSWAPHNMLLASNMWLVSLSQLRDLAIVTMIGDKPRIRPDIRMQERSCSSRTQNRRYENLLELASGRHIPIEEEFRDKFTPARDRQIFADINYNLSVLENFDEEAYPSLAKYRKQRVFEHLRGIMLNMLAHESPVWPMENPRFFITGKLYLESWCKEYGYATGSTKSWQGSLIFLTDCALIKCFRPMDNTTDPRLARIYAALPPKHGKNITLRSVPRYTVDVLAHAEHIASMYLVQRIGLANLTKTDVIRCRGKRIANQLYLDGRTISETEMYIHDLYMRFLLESINEKGYATKNEINYAIVRTLYYEQHFKRIERDHVLTEEEREEYNRQQPYWDAYSKMKGRCAQIAVEAGYDYHPIRNIDRTTLHLPDDFSSWIIS